MDEQRECDVVRGLKEGRAEAWRACYDSHAERVWNAVAKWMGPRSTEIADVVQETFMAAAKSVATYQAERGTLGFWLMGIARRQVALHYRREGRHQRLRRAFQNPNSQEAEVCWDWIRQESENNEPVPDDMLMSSEMADIIRLALLELPEDYGLLLTARYLEEISVEDLAKTESTTITAIRSKLARARRALKEVFLSRASFAEEGPAKEYHET